MSVAQTGAREQRALRLWLRLLACTNLIEQRLRSRLRSDFEITLPQFDVLAELERSAAPQTMSELSARLMVSNGNVTGVVDRLERAGYVRREADKRDRRVQFIRLTPAGRKLFTRMSRAHAAWVAELFDGLRAQEAERLTKQLRRVREIVGAAGADQAAT